MNVEIGFNWLHNWLLCITTIFINLYLTRKTSVRLKISFSRVPWKKRLPGYLQIWHSAYEWTPLDLWDLQHITQDSQRSTKEQLVFAVQRLNWFTDRQQFCSHSLSKGQYVEVWSHHHGFYPPRWNHESIQTFCMENLQEHTAGCSMRVWRQPNYVWSSAHTEGIKTQHVLIERFERSWGLLLPITQTA